MLFRSKWVCVKATENWEYQERVVDGCRRALTKFSAWTVMPDTNWLMRGGCMKPVLRGFLFGGYAYYGSRSPKGRERIT